MDSAAVATTSATPAAQSTGVAFEDGLGERRRVTDPATRDTLEVLCLRGELTAVPVFEFALRERVSRLADFHDEAYGHVRSVERLNDRRSTLALVSDWTPGVRLSEILAVVEQRRIPLEPNAALQLVRQLVSAVGTLHETAGEVSHGAIGPERIVISPNGRPVLVEHVLGSALERLRFSHERYWKELHLPLPRSAGLPRFDRRADIMQCGAVALTLVLGRPLRDEETPAHLGDLLASGSGVTSDGPKALPPAIRAWISRALQLDVRTAFTSIVEARSELDKALAESGAKPSPAAFEAVLSQYRAATEPAAAPPSPVPVPLPAPQSVPVKVVQASAPTPLRKVELPRPQESGRKEPEPMPHAPMPADDELDDDEDRTPARSPRRRWVGAVAAAVILIAAGGGGMLAARRYGLPSVSSAPTGTLALDSDPVGATVVVDGEQKGLTPVTLTLKAGTHLVELSAEGGDPRKISLTIPAGGQLSQYLELAKSAPAAGQLQVRTDPSGATVTVDGEPRGTSPLTIGKLAAGDHSVVIASELGSVTHSVTVEAGVTASLFVPLAARDGAPVSGWIAVSSPVDVQLYENSRLLGSSESERIMVSAGTHQIEVVNTALGYRATRSLQVGPGRVASLAVKLPDGTLDLNAVPWAEVWIDGKKAGDTPLGNVPVTIGAHEITFRNPDLGEQRHKVTVTATAPARLSVDMRKK